MLVFKSTWATNDQEDWEPGFYVKHFIKDMEIALNDARKNGIGFKRVGVGKILLFRSNKYGLSRKRYSGIIEGFKVYE
jgi:3-hydroxyisobutyrate dehydrogenase-like beta-hydroxyacid dehydrogenase